MDYKIRAAAAQGSLRAMATLTTHSARSAQIAHRAGPLAAAAMGRTMSAASLLATDLKDQGRLLVELDGGGPLGPVSAESRGRFLRARVEVPHLDLSLRPDGKLAVGQAVGQDGHFRVRRETVDGQFWESRTALVSGEVGDDLMQYYLESEQVASAVALGVLVATDGLVAASGGIVVQALPGSDHAVDQVAERFQELSQISHRLAAGESLEDLLRAVLPEPVVWLAQETLEFRCQCSRDHSQAILQSLPEDDLVALVAEHGAEVICNYCRTSYRFSQKVLESWLNARDGAGDQTQAKK